jgi:riboflavin kinase
MPDRVGPVVTQEEAVRAVVVPGRREAAGFVTVPWVREQLGALLGGNPFAGTLNVQVSDQPSLDAWRRTSAEGDRRTLTPGEPGYCESSYFPAWLNATVPCGVVVPHVSGYPPDVLEVVAVENLRNRCGLDDGAIVTLTFQATSRGGVTRPAPGAQ